MKPSFHTTASGYRIAYDHAKGSSPTGVLFCCGYRSDLTSTKATALAEWCAANNVPFTRFDYNGHGQSEGEFTDFTIGGAIADALEILDNVATQPQLIVGSSMGAWIALHAALARKSQIRGFIGIAAAPDFTERLMFARMTPEQRQEMEDEGKIWVPSDYGDDYPITRNFIHEARNHLLLDDIISLDKPAHLFHGQDDVDVPWEITLLLSQQLTSDEVTMTLIKDGDHRLSRPQDMAMLTDAVGRLLAV